MYPARRCGGIMSANYISAVNCGILTILVWFQDSEQVPKQKQPEKKIAHSLVAVSVAGVLAVYAAGYARTHAQACGAAAACVVIAREMEGRLLERLGPVPAWRYRGYGGHRRRKHHVRRNQSMPYPVLLQRYQRPVTSSNSAAERRSGLRFRRHRKYQRFLLCSGSGTG